MCLKKHGVRSGICKLNSLNEMSDEENASSELQPPAGETSTAQNATNTNTNTNSTPTLPTGLKLPQPLKMEGNLAANWKRFKRAWQNYSVIARLDKFEENYKTALFLSVIGEEALEVFEGMDFSSGTDKQVLSKVIEKFEEFCIGETNETYERFIFNRRNQEENESIDQYVTVIRKLAQTCNFCNCLNDSLLRDRLVLGIKDESTRKKLLQEKKLTLSRAIDIGRSGEKTNLRLKELKKPGGADDEVNVVKYNKKKENERQSKSQETRRGSCRYCGGNHRRGACPAYGQTCHNCGRKNHFSQVCLQKRKLPANVVTQYNHPDDSDEDSGEYVATLDLHPQQEKILIVKSGQYQSKIHTTMKIKGGQNTSFQVDTGATCNVIRRKELLGTKYEKNITKTNQVLRMYNSSPLIPTGICYVQLTNPANGQKYNVRFVVVDEKDADINLLGSRAVQQMKLIQVNHRNIQTDTHEVQAVGNQGPSQMVNDASVQGHQSKGALTKEEILKQYPDVFEGLGSGS